LTPISDRARAYAADEVHRLSLGTKTTNPAMTRRFAVHCNLVLAIRGKALGPDHPSVATSLENLAELYRATNRINLAVPLEQRAAQIRAIER